jgi:ubiquitin-activating enzyme E1
VFTTEFHHNIAQLLHSFPRDCVSAQGTPFWSGPKRAPTAVAFDASDNTHFDFVFSAALLRAQTFGLDLSGVQHTDSKWRDAAAAVPLEPFVPKSMKIATTKEEQEALEKENDKDANEVDSLLAEMPARDVLNAKPALTVAEFEKDDDSNFHMCFIRCVCV